MALMYEDSGHKVFWPAGGLPHNSSKLDVVINATTCQFHIKPYRIKKRAILIKMPML